MLNPQVGVARSLGLSFRGQRDGAEEFGMAVDLFTEGILEEPGTFVDTAEAAKRGGVRAVDSACVIGGRPDRFQDDCTGGGFRVEGQDDGTTAPLDHTGKGKATIIQVLRLDGLDQGRVILELCSGCKAFLQGSHLES